MSREREKMQMPFAHCFCALKCQAQHVCIYPDLATDFRVTGTHPSFSLSCSENVVKFEEAVLVNKPSQQITSLRKHGA